MKLLTGHREKCAVTTCTANCIDNFLAAIKHNG
jgi:hypothetical protein